MKKFFLLFIVLAGALLTSCKKEYITNNNVLQSRNVCNLYELAPTKAIVIDPALYQYTEADGSKTDYITARSATNELIYVATTDGPKSINTQITVEYRYAGTITNFSGWTPKKYQHQSICQGSDWIIFDRWVKK